MPAALLLAALAAPLFALVPMVAYRRRARAPRVDDSSSPAVHTASSDDDRAEAWRDSPLAPDLASGDLADDLAWQRIVAAERAARLHGLVALASASARRARG